VKSRRALAALHEGVITPNTTVYSKGYIEIPNPYVPDKPSRFVEFNQEELGLLNVRSAIARSSNVFFYTAGGGFEGIKGLGISRLYTYWQKFGFGSKTGVEADNENIGFLPTPEEKEQRTHQPWRIGDTYNVSIGQGDFRVSPLQLLNAIASIANNGVMYRPNLVHSIGDGPVTTPVQVLDYSDWKMELTEVQAGMRDGVQKTYGRSYLLHDLPFTSAAKTGSAQIANNTKTNALFVGYAPFENPQIAIEVLIENAVTGSLNAVPIAKDVLNWYYQNRLINQVPQ
jgi:penicillin-binding protein 2